MHLTRILIATMLLCGCSEWPPEEQKFLQHFNENRTEIDELRHLLEESKYQAVHYSGTRVTGYYFEGEPYDGQIAEEEEPGESDRWVELFNQIDTYSVQVEDSGVVWFHVRPNVMVGKLDSVVSFMHGADIDKSFKVCDRRFAKVRCGHCIVSLDADWWLTYRWWPSDLTDKEFDAWMDGDMSEDEFYEVHDRIRHECFVEGGTLLGQSEFP
jgi:hypothetical protein